MLVTDTIVETVLSQQPKPEYFLGWDTLIRFAPGLADWAAHFDLKKFGSKV